MSAKRVAKKKLQETRSLNMDHEVELGRRGTAATLRRNTPVVKGTSGGHKYKVYAFGVDYGDDSVTGPANGSCGQSSQDPSPPSSKTSSVQNGHITSVTIGSTASCSDVSQLVRSSSLLNPFGDPVMRTSIRRLKLEPQQMSPEQIAEECEAVKRASKLPNGDTIFIKRPIRNMFEQITITGDPSWAGHKLAGRVHDSRTPSIKSYWEKNIRDEERMFQAEAMTNSRRSRSYGFPKWRSTDALSASLVASNPVEIPKDSRIPEERLIKMEQTEREAEHVKQLIHDSTEPPRRLQKGKSLDSISIQAEQQKKWYDREKIKDGISRESIGNIGGTRQMFEAGEVSNIERNNRNRDRTFSLSSVRTEPLPPPSQMGQPFVPPTSTSRPLEAQAPPPLPPKSEEVQQRQHAIVPNGNSYQVDNYMDPRDAYPPPPQRVQQAAQQNGFTAHYPTSQRFEPEPQYEYSFDQQLLMLYLKQNPDISHSLGVQVSDSTRLAMEEVPWRKVEIRTVDDDWMSQSSYQQQAFSPSQRNGRYLKKNQIQQAPSRFKRNDARNERQDSVDESETRSVESLIATEIRVAKEREEELRRSRSELGLPTLEESMDIWRSGHHRNLVLNMNPLRGAQSVERLHHQLNGSQMQKTSSTGELQHAEYYGRRQDEPPRNGFGVNYRPQQPVSNYPDQHDIYSQRRPMVTSLKRFD